ncbi:ABC transporter substrate-binding protein [Arthrobacter sp. W4I7]|uniref:ABC transporter substrate-binding protein n=1 Tax=Arthrobacter sp. W4I7 TaxID=3042296 RepID=UPI0027870F40|nr:ABC transporter substrate-binding protein [Arthrobacter sp. W4I7]MDQ0691304.1 peptide/nickel transport system substrate-binding protein [Arthrobacter sp. W4I7]
MHSNRTRFTVIRAAAAVAALFAVIATSACSSDGTGPSESDATIKLSVLGTFPSLDPSLLDDGQSAYVWQSVYDTLVYIDNDGTLQPNAAESWEYSTDGLTLTLNLRDDMTFSSGDPVTADAVVKTFERTKSMPGLHQGQFASVSSVEAADDTTVVVQFSQPDGAFLPSLGTAIGVIGDPETIDDENSALRPVGSGAYELDAAATTDGSTYVLKRRDDYWNADAYPFSTVTVRVIADSTAAFNALQAGEINAGMVQPDQAQALANNPQFKLSKVDANSLASILLMDRNGEVAPALADVRVRRAMNMAFDRDGFVTNVLRGRGSATQQFVNPKSGAFVESLDDTYTFDIEGAKALLAEAGYPDGFALTLPSTFLSQQLEPLVTQAMAQIGITLTWQPVPAQEAATALASKKFPAAFFIRNLNLPARDTFDYYGNGGYLNPFAPEDPELAALIAKASTVVDETGSGAAYQDVVRYATENALTLPLFYAGVTWATTPDITYLGNGSNTNLSVRNFGVSE